MKYRFNRQERQDQYSALTAQTRRAQRRREKGDAWDRWLLMRKGESGYCLGINLWLLKAMVPDEFTF